MFVFVVQKRICKLFREKEELDRITGMAFDWLSEQAASVTNVLEAGTFRLTFTITILIHTCIILKFKYSHSNYQFVSVALLDN